MDKRKEDLISRIQEHYPKLSKSQKIIAEYILNHYDKAAFMTASKLGEKVGVSESTVVRFANTLGYDGYPELHDALQELIKLKLTTVQRLELSDDLLNKESILKTVLKADINNIKTTLEEIDINVFETIVEKILKAKRIYIIGLRSSTALAEYMGFYLNLILDNIKIVTQGISDIFEQIFRVSKGDLVIGISFPRYSRRTIEALKFAKSQGADIVAITDSFISPLAGISDHVLLAKSNMASFVDSLVAPLSIINALVVAVGVKEKEKVSQTFKKLEDIWSESQIYTNNKV